MTGLQKKILGLTAVMAGLFFAGVAVAAESRVDELQRLPLEEQFRAGFGDPVGSVVHAEGGAFIVHAAGDKRYPAVPGRSIYKGDSLFTVDDGRMVFALKDGSRMTVAANTAIEVTRSIYNPDTGTRSSFLNMMFGRVRFVVRDLADYRHSRFNVKTKSSVVGVRGSDFIITQTLTRSEIITLKDTLLEVISLEDPSAGAILMTAFQKLGIEMGELAGPPEDITVEQALEIIRSIFSGDISEDDYDDVEDQAVYDEDGNLVDPRDDDEETWDEPGGSFDEVLAGILEALITAEDVEEVAGDLMENLDHVEWDVLPDLPSPPAVEEETFEGNGGGMLVEG